jgi:hypothetical protein
LESDRSKFVGLAMEVSPAKKAWITNPKIGSEAIVTGEFGESLVAFLLSKKGIDVAKAGTVGFDLFAIDAVGRIFPKGKIVGISVKTRFGKKHGSFRPTIPIGSAKIVQAQKTWDIDAWVAVVAGSKDDMPSAFVFPLEDLPKLKGRAKREDVVAISDLAKNPTGSVTKL